MSGDTNATGIFTPIEIDTIGEIMNISMGSAATAASTLLDNKVNITTPIVKIITVEEFTIEQLDPAIAVEIQYVEGISGSNVLILKRSDVRSILSQMMMTELPEDFALDEMAESAICELMNQMMGSSATVLSCFLGRNINISTPRTVPIGELETFKETYFAGDNAVVSIEFTLSIGDTIESVFVCAMKVNLAKEIIDVSLNFDAGEGLEEDAGTAQATSPPAMSASEPAMPPPPPPQVQQAPPPPPQQQIPPPPPPQPQIPQQQPMAQPAPDYYAPAAYPPQGYQPLPYAPPPYGYPPYPQPQYAPPPPGYEQQPVAVKDYHYGDFSQPGGGDKGHPTNMDLVLNVPVMMTVELGRTKRKIKEILEFGQGTIVELDKQAGSQVDVIVNGQLIAHGDVVVVDDNFSIRITEIIKNKDPLSML